MTLKQYIETHPLPTLVVVAAATATATAGIIAATAIPKHEAEKAKIEADYKSDVSGLKARLASIERKLGSDEKTYFDVSQLVVTPDRVKSLDQAYKSGGGGLFFYLQPVGEQWKYELISEGELAMLKLAPEDIDPSMAKLFAALGQKNLHLWRKDQHLELHPKAKKGFESRAPKTIRFFPMVAVQALSEAQFQEAVGGFSKFVEDESDLKKLSNTLDRLLADLKTTGPTSSASAPNQVAASASQASLAATGVKDLGSGDKQLELESFLRGLFRGDLAAAVLGGLISQTLQLPRLFEGAEGSLNSVQKKGNVLYIQMTLRFSDASVSGLDKPANLTVDREIFIVTNTKNIYVVQVEVPTLDGRSDAYPWVGQWLSSVRIPI